MYELIKKDGRAKRGRLTTVHGVIETPVFMNVGTVAAIKGAVSTDDLKDIGTQVELSNTYHLHVRTGDKLIKEFGGLHKFMHWDRPILTDSGGFQVFSLAKLRKIKEEGVSFASHIDGRKIFMGPEESMQIQSNLGSTIAMAFDECPPHPATREYIMDTILTNFNDGASILISTHLISDVERILDEVIFVDDGMIHLTGSADELRNQRGKSIDEIFREEFRC